MILLDTNVISEPTRPAPDATVLKWIDAQSLETLHLPAIALAEMLEGISRLPVGQKRQQLESVIAELVEKMIGSRVLAFDRKAAERFGFLIATARRKGVQVSFADGQIAAIADTNGLTVATRDTAPFIAMLVPVINPWEPEAREIRPSVTDVLASDDVDLETFLPSRR